MQQIRAEWLAERKGGEGFWSRGRKKGRAWVLSSGSPMWMLKSFGMVAGPDGKGDCDPVAKDSKEEWCINGNRRSRV